MWKGTGRLTEEVTLLSSSFINSKTLGQDTVVKQTKIPAPSELNSTGGHRRQAYVR